MLQYYTCMQYTVRHKNESKHSEMGPVRQNPIQRTVSSVRMCEQFTVYNCCTQYCTELIIFRLALQTITIAPMMSI